MEKPTIDVDIIQGTLSTDRPKALVSVNGAVRIQFERILDESNKGVWRLCQQYAGYNVYERYQSEIDKKLAEAEG